MQSAVDFDVGIHKNAKTDIPYWGRTNHLAFLYPLCDDLVDTFIAVLSQNRSQRLEAKLATEALYVLMCVGPAAACDIHYVLVNAEIASRTPEFKKAERLSGELLDAVQDWHDDDLE